LTIVQDNEFISNLKKIFHFIAKDTKTKAKAFNSALYAKISNLSTSPYKCRKSFYYDDVHVRDMIFKGYTIVYLIDEENDTIVILDIFKWIDK
jgi:plasmid stabilization system protein ParE